MEASDEPNEEMPMDGESIEDLNEEALSGADNGVEAAATAKAMDVAAAGDAKQLDKGKDKGNAARGTEAANGSNLKGGNEAAKRKSAEATPDQNPREGGDVAAVVGSEASDEVAMADNLNIVYGILLMYLMSGNNNGQSISGLDESYTGFITGSVISLGGTPIPNYVWYSLIITALMWFVWNKTTFGKNMFAVGSNPDAANVSGVNVKRVITLVFMLAGIMYGITGFIEAARIGSNSAATGLNYELDAIAASVIGGVSFVGGIGKIRGVIMGVVLLRLIFVGLTFLSIDANMQYVIKGLIILIACAIDMRKYLVRK